MQAPAQPLELFADEPIGERMTDEQHAVVCRSQPSRPTVQRIVQLARLLLGWIQLAANSANARFIASRAKHPEFSM